jgi:hypothetical protein
MKKDDIYPDPIRRDPLWMIVLSFLMGKFARGL